jgi:hypothetical protein
MRKLAKFLGVLIILVALSGCGNKATPQATPQTTAAPTTSKQTPMQKQLDTTNQATQTTTSDIPEIKSTNPNTTELNNLAKDVDSLDHSAQGLDENQDLSAE